MAETELDPQYRTTRIPIEAGVVAVEAAAQEEVDGEELTTRIIAQMDDRTSVRDDGRITQANPWPPNYHHHLALAVEATLVVA